MNTIKLALSILSLITVLAFYSCDNEPIDPKVDLEASNSNAVGSYALTAYNTSIPTDLNNDGTVSINQMTETQCFNNNVLTINSNNTFSITSKGVEIVNPQTTPTMTCYTHSIIIGTWAIANNVLTLTYIEAGVTVTDDYILAGNTLTNTKDQIEIVATTSNDTPVYLTSDVVVVYSK